MLHSLPLQSCGHLFTSLVRSVIFRSNPHKFDKELELRQQWPMGKVCATSHNGPWLQLETWVAIFSRYGGFRCSITQKSWRKRKNTHWIQDSKNLKWRRRPEGADSCLLSWSDVSWILLCSVCGLIVEHSWQGSAIQLACFYGGCSGFPKYSVFPLLEGSEHQSPIASDFRSQAQIATGSAMSMYPRSSRNPCKTKKCLVAVFPHFLCLV